MQGSAAGFTLAPTDELLSVKQWFFLSFIEKHSNLFLWKMKSFIQIFYDHFNSVKILSFRLIDKIEIKQSNNFLSHNFFYLFCGININIGIRGIKELFNTTGSSNLFHIPWTECSCTGLQVGLKNMINWSQLMILITIVPMKWKIILRFDGQLILPYMTPAQLEMEDGDVVDVFQVRWLSRRCQCWL